MWLYIGVAATEKKCMQMHSHELNGRISSLFNKDAAGVSHALAHVFVLDQIAFSKARAMEKLRKSLLTPTESRALYHNSLVTLASVARHRTPPA